MSKKFIENYLVELQKEFYLKEYEILNNAHRQIFTHKENNTFLSLKDIFKKQQIIKRSVIQNEINSINQVQQDKIIIFHTSTIDPVLNVPRKIDEAKQLEELIKNQYEEFNKYFRTITKRNNDKKITYKNIRVYELTKKLNIHCHKTDLLKSENDFIRYLEAIILSRNKNNIGRVELVVNSDFFEAIQKLFKDKQIKIRVNNKYEVLSLMKRSIKFQGEKQSVYIVKETKKGEGNFIYFRTILDNKGTGQHLTDYMFKYMLKSFDFNEENKLLEPRSKVSKETLIFSKLKLRQKIYSINFFTDKLQKDDLEKLNGRFFTFFKQRERNQINILSYFNKDDFDFINNGRRHLFYTLSKMLEDKRIFIVQEENILINEYKKIKTIIRANIDLYDIKKKDSFFEFVKERYIGPNYLTAPQFDKKFLKEVKDYLDHKKTLKGFLRAYNDIFGKDTLDEEETEEEVLLEDNKDDKLIMDLTREIFPYFVKEYNYKNTDKEVYYFDSETNKDYLIHSFSSDYTYEKYSSDVELYEDILLNKNDFNETDKLQNSINYYNAITELLDLDLEPLTIKMVKENLRQEREERREYQNKQIEKVMEELPEN
ncbi:MAG: hypothetical protein Q8N01_03545 [Sulfuricurvum sp.]|nr:hypothetical protein [Sulfuricurvum sp.]MDP3023373.1 hypothetical protein [Sulfuricurvum sp.]MDP3119478.1 hypothetical protein [Sulfuricurvum sp.]